MVATATTSAIPDEASMEMPTFAETLEAHKAMVFSIAWHVLRDRSAAEELAQDVFLQLHCSWRSMKSREHIVFWLRKVATHRALDQVRKRNNRPETSLEETGEPTVLERMQDSLLSSYLERMIASLPDRQRAAIVLRYQEDMAPDEIARVLDMNVSTVKTLITRGLDLLRSKTKYRLGVQSERGDRHDGV
ncbi:MAG: sigma-70 family RNA polymerase sigma factor [Acidobacteriaceae bacterium]|nr:sigma-70 family RNA polymerase sigma factor [Acidobacteriaceae bacterium]